MSTDGTHNCDSCVHTGVCKYEDAFKKFIENTISYQSEMCQNNNPDLMGLQVQTNFVCIRYSRDITSTPIPRS